MQRKAYSYIRMSTNLQLKGDSLRRQLESSQAYATANGLELVESIDGVHLRDIGVSGFRGKNATKGVLALFLDYLYAGKIGPDSVLLVESLDRLSRDKVTAAFRQFLEILENGIEVVTLADGLRYTKDSINSNQGQLFISLGIMVRANDESEMKSIRLRSLWKNKRDNASSKKLTAKGPAWLRYDKDSGVFVYDEEKVELVRKIFHMCADTCGIYGLVRYLNENSVPVFGRGKIWHRSYVAKVIKNRAVLGEFQPGSRVDGKQVNVGEPIKNYYPAVVTEAEFIAANAAIERRKASCVGRKGTVFRNVFTGLSYCKTCGSKMILRNRGKPPKGSSYLCCTNQYSGGGCEMPEWRLDEVEKAILRHLHELDFGSLGVGEKSTVAEIDNKISSCEYTLNELDGRKNRALEEMLQKDHEPEVKAWFRDTLNSLLKSISEHNDQLARLKIQREESLEANSLLKSSALKELFEKLQTCEDDFFFRSSLNELLRKTIIRIDFVKNPFVYQPWDYEDNDIEVVTYRATAAKRQNLSLNELVKRKSFEKHCEGFSRQLRVQYKVGGFRIIEVGRNCSYRGTTNKRMIEETLAE